MITLRRHAERQQRRGTGPDAWHSFHPAERADAVLNGFGALVRLDEYRLAPGAEIASRPRRRCEELTYVCEGALAYQNSAGQSGLLLGGDFQVRATAHIGSHCQANPSHTEHAHVVQVALGPSPVPLTPGHTDRRFSAASRRGLWCLVASPDGREGSLGLSQDVLVLSCLLDEGRHVVHPLRAGRRAWLQLLRGSATVAGLELGAGDGAGLRGVPAVSVTAHSGTELLLFDLPDALEAHAAAEPPQD